MERNTTRSFICPTCGHNSMRERWDDEGRKVICRRCGWKGIKISDIIRHPSMQKRTTRV